jgi:hypothetical protein
MGHGTKKGVVDGQFIKRVSDLEKKADKAKTHFRDHGGYREWWTPDGVVDPLDVPSLHEPNWQRNNINQIYSDSILTNSDQAAGTTGDLFAMKWQADFMAVEERAFRTRHASFVRCASLAHGRLDGHSIPVKGVFGHLKSTIDKALEEGAKTG